MQPQRQLSMHDWLARIGDWKRLLHFHLRHCCTAVLFLKFALSKKATIHSSAIAVSCRRPRFQYWGWDQITLNSWVSTAMIWEEFKFSISVCCKINTNQRDQALPARHQYQWCRTDARGHMCAMHVWRWSLMKSHESLSSVWRYLYALCFDCCQPAQLDGCFNFCCIRKSFLTPMSLRLGQRQSCVNNAPSGT